MDKKLKDIIIIVRMNLFFLIISISTVMVFIAHIGLTLYTIKFKTGSILYNVEYSIFLLKIYATNYRYNSVYVIGNYPLIPIVAAIIYNLYVMIKNNNDKIDS